MRVIKGVDMNINRIKELYSYDKTTGEFTKLSDGSKPNGYTGLRVDGKKVSKNKIAWILTYGEEPQHPLRFIDGDKTNFKIDNIELKNKAPRDESKSRSRLAARAKIDEMANKIAQGYDDLEYAVAGIGSANILELKALGYDLPSGTGYKWLIKVTDLIKINSSTIIKVTCPDCGEVRTTMANRGDKKCRSCTKKGVVFTREHRARISSSKRDESLTEEERVNRRSMPWMKAWAKEVKVRANFTCEACGQVGGKLASHHKDSYRSNKMRRTDILNGVCLCEDCHKDFHKQYGQGNNTVDQFEEWILNKLEERVA